jgi:hypothetical protein
LRPSAEVQVDSGKPTQVEMPKALIISDDDPTQARPPPVMKPRAAEPAPQAHAPLARGRKEGTEEYVPRRSIHPLIPIGVLLAALLLLLLAINWLRSSSTTDGEDEPTGIHTLFNW